MIPEIRGVKTERIGSDVKGRDVYRLISKDVFSDRETLVLEPSSIQDFFKDKGFEISEPLGITESRTTLFVCAGVQILESIWERNFPPPENIILFVAQPVLRSQFMGYAGEGVSTSFVNLATVAMGINETRYGEMLRSWLSFLKLSGIDLSEVRFVLEEKEDKWGDKRFSAKTIRFRYRDISLGDANYIKAFPAKFGEISLVDIGFGLERIRWIGSGTHYWSFLKDFNEVNFNVLDLWNTLALLAGSGITPSNNERGYRFRRASKLLCERIGYRRDSEKFLLSAYNRWKDWANLQMEVDRVRQVVRKELDRNANSILKSKLVEAGFHDVGIDINLPPEEFLKLLRGTSVNREILEKILEEMGYII